MSACRRRYSASSARTCSTTARKCAPRRRSSSRSATSDTMWRATATSQRCVRACVRFCLQQSSGPALVPYLGYTVDRLARVLLLRYLSTLVASVGVHAMPRSIHERSHSALWGAHRPSAVRGVAQEASITVVGDGRGLKAPSTLMRLLTAVQGPLLVKVAGKEWREQGSWGGRVRSVGGDEDGRGGEGGREAPTG